MKIIQLAKLSNFLFLTSFSSKLYCLENLGSNPTTDFEI
jgi:hypothetical protein